MPVAIATAAMPPSPITRGKRLGRRDQPTAAFVEKRRYRGEPLPDGLNIDHHHNI
jgi:hypothetical protein